MQATRLESRHSFTNIMDIQYTNVGIEPKAHHHPMLVNEAAAKCESQYTSFMEISIQVDLHII